jgi:DsbC/DsbD-like thiol-disulfide interchange protein
MNLIRRFARPVLPASAVALLLVTAAQAEDASAWSEDSHSAVRLIAGSNAAGTAPLRAGVEMKLQPGWHTYWRYPGDSGVPPRFDFAGSENLKDVKVLYPAPRLHRDETGQTLGYENSVIFPLQVTPRQPDKPVRLRLKIDYAVCEKLCMPVDGQADLALGAGDSAQEPMLKMAEARVPKQVSAAALGLTARRVNNAAKPLVAVDFTVPADKPVAVYVEGPSPEWALPIPSPAQGAPAGHRQFAFELDGLPPGVDPRGRFDLTFTVVEGDSALEVTTHLD